ncbi:hypothetical protein EJ08DRAFT_701796 [Tothia fuscella]|uniref:Uncharacterized protein n=1 Tax=Tothia fuscella TaxID=1048955 RepID=A0A9P4TTV0_9PEZI|nr:hypothetical protein EJ08DRAFT_701796 [Tothia fuscella]
MAAKAEQLDPNALTIYQNADAYDRLRRRVTDLLQETHEAAVIASGRQPKKREWWIPPRIRNKLKRNMIHILMNLSVAYNDSTLEWVHDESEAREVRQMLRYGCFNIGGEDGLHVSADNMTDGDSNDDGRDVYDDDSDDEDDDDDESDGNDKSRREKKK